MLYDMLPFEAIMSIHLQNILLGYSVNNKLK